MMETHKYAYDMIWSVCIKYIKNNTAILKTLNSIRSCGMHSKQRKKKVISNSLFFSIVRLERRKTTSKVNFHCSGVLNTNNNIEMLHRKRCLIRYKNEKSGSNFVILQKIVKILFKSNFLSSIRINNCERKV